MCGLFRNPLIVLVILLAVPATAALILMAHTQIIAGTIQKLTVGTVNTINSYDPLGEPMEGIKDNGQYIITEVKYSENYPNSFLDITIKLSKKRSSQAKTICELPYFTSQKIKLVAGYSGFSFETCPASYRTSL